MTKPLQLYDLVYHDGVIRMIHGVLIEDEHTCWYHSMPCKAVVYVLSDSTNHSRIGGGGASCEVQLEVDGYRKMTKRDANKDNIKYKAYSTEIPGEVSFSHLYVLSLDGNKWFVGLTSDFQESLDLHRGGKVNEWTREYPVVRVESVTEFDPPLPEHEAVVPAIKIRTNLYDKYGRENVRSNIRFVRADHYRHRYYR